MKQQLSIELRVLNAVHYGIPRSAIQIQNSTGCIMAAAWLHVFVQQGKVKRTKNGMYLRVKQTVMCRSGGLRCTSPG